MKNILFKCIVWTLSLTVITSCVDKNWVDYDINNDPDAPTTVPMSLILPAAQQSMAYHLVGNNTVRTTAIWMQQFDGIARQSFTEARYQLTPADVNTVWGAMYTEVLMNCQLIMEKAGTESPHFTGVVQVMTAASLGVLTDLFGDIPYSDALGGRELNIKPKYDTQESIYTTIFTLLDDAIVNLESADNLYDLEGDLIFGNDTDKWIKAAYSLKARHHIQLSEVNGNAAYTSALDAAAKGFTSGSDDMKLSFTSKNKSPFYQFMDQRGDIVMGSKMWNIFYDLPGLYWDPRIDSYYDDFFDSGASDPGSENADASLPGDFLAAEDASVYIMSYAELLFIMAEANAELGNTSDAEENLEDAIVASFIKAGLEASDDNYDGYVEDAEFFAGDTSLTNIITHKYLDGFGTNQPYSDWRRTGIPSLSLAQGAKLSQIPTRFPYAQDEISYNGANVPKVQVTDKLWWDK